MATARDELQEITGEELPPGYLRYPESARGSRATTSAQDLQQFGTQAGLIGLGFAPGAGMADYLGYFPSAEGGTEPSAVQNWQQGNYGTAAMQGLGAMGDLALGIPVAGAAIGSVMKAPRAAQKMLQELPKIDELGFYSQAEKALTDIPQQKGTGQQFLAQLQKTPGVKPEELQYTGLTEFLANKPSVTKAEIQDYLDTNRVQIQEVRLENNANPYDFDSTVDFDIAISRAERAGNWDEVDRLEQAREAFEGFGTAGQTRYHLGSSSTQTEIPGGTNYREVLLTLPSEARGATDVEINALNDRLIAKGFDGLGEEEISSLRSGRNDAIAMLEDYDARLGVRTNDLIEVMQGGMSSDVFRSSHFDQPNILAHMRLNDRVVDGKPTLFIEEIQSDWHQAGRKEGYKKGDMKNKLDALTDERQKVMNAYRNTPDGKDASQLRDRLREIDSEYDVLQKAYMKGVPDAPFKTSWHELTLKKALNEAATKGYDQIAFTTGKTQSDRYDLSKQIDSIKFGKPKEDGTIAWVAEKNGEKVAGARSTPEDIERNLGKDIAQKIIGAEGRPGELSGLDLQVGGEGMKGFYDNIVPKSLNKIGKKYGTSVRKTTMDTPDGEVEVWAMDLTPEMRETITTQGQPLFQIGAGAAGLGTAGAGTAGIMALTPGESEAGQ